MKNLVVLLLLLANMAQGQTIRKRPENGVYLTAKDFEAGIVSHGFTSSDDEKLLDNKRGYIVIKQRDSTTRFYFDQLWGYRKEGVDWRLYNEEGYRVESTNKICLYSVPVCVACLTTQPLYFSVDAVSPLHPLSRKNLLDVYHSNKAFVEKIKHLPWTSSIMKKDKATHKFRFIGWL
ncbi:hypothetical protein GWC95_19100 [Sediminibacterium roseum]|uniref:WG containing repeat-containing protein n=1 Tax=Sediminibacterium roseum TaxID=1978412 RepID=A0ABX0A4B5_9BACT|nr:hypothetical protein [Sediminibacterium roseum]NCI52040.1 hypothetical protein [Sediminibacterium roseum]